MWGRRFRLACASMICIQGVNPPMDRNGRTIRLGKGVRPESGDLKKADDENRGVDVQEAIEGLAMLGHPAGLGSPICHSERLRGRSDGLREEGKSYLRRSLLWSIHTGHCGQYAADRSREVSRSHSSPTG